MFTPVYVHESLSPAAWAAALAQSLRSRNLASQFLYESPKQARRWLAVHQQYSPARQDPAVAAIYSHAAAGTVSQIESGPVAVIGLGCGGGQKELELLRQLTFAGHRATYVPVDASLPLVLTATQAASAAQPELQCHPVVADLTAATELPDLLDEILPENALRMFTFYGLLPNFEPELVQARLRKWLRPGDRLLLSANLAPGEDYAGGVRKILPQYDNLAMREWLLTWPADVGMDLSAASLNFQIATHPGPPDLRRIEARLHFHQPQEIRLEGQSFAFAADDQLRLFHSYRYTPGRVLDLLNPTGLTAAAQWVAPSGEEAVFLIQ